MKDFAAIDFETANGKRTSVCSVGIVIVKGGKIVNKIYRLIRPAPNYYTQLSTDLPTMTLWKRMIFLKYGRKSSRCWKDFRL